MPVPRTASEEATDLQCKAANRKRGVCFMSVLHLTHACGSSVTLLCPLQIEIEKMRRAEKILVGQDSSSEKLVHSQPSFSMYIHTQMNCFEF